MFCLIQFKQFNCKILFKDQDLTQYIMILGVFKLNAYSTTVHTKYFSSNRYE